MLSNLLLSDIVIKQTKLSTGEKAFETQAPNSNSGPWALLHLLLWENCNLSPDILENENSNSHLDTGGLF